MKTKYGRFWTLSSTAEAEVCFPARDAVSYGVIKMNVDTDCHRSLLSRPVVDHVMKNYDGMLRIDGEMGRQKRLKTQ